MVQPSRSISETADGNTPYVPADSGSLNFSSADSVSADTVTFNYNPEDSLMNFSDVFEEKEQPLLSEYEEKTADTASPPEKKDNGIIYPLPHKKGTKRSISVRSDKVRVLVLEGVKRLDIAGSHPAFITDNNHKKMSLQTGTITLSNMQRKSGVYLVSAATMPDNRVTCFLPCTLNAKGYDHTFRCDDIVCRGALIIIPGRAESFSVINYLPVEEYLKGVVPLELGRVDASSIEALKAQAIAARTYTYKKMNDRYGQPFDLYRTVSDQVYGGVKAEYPLGDRAVKETEKMVMTHNDNLIYAYYHSTCGGRTASIEDVWVEKPAYPYLRSILDTDDSDTPYCSKSYIFNWKEVYTVGRLSGIINRFCLQVAPQKPAFQGMIKQIILKTNSHCGRALHCQISNNKSVFTYYGDKLRFLFRRPVDGFPILRSTYFEISKPDKDHIMFVGKGSGHGVGMCQIGAIGRAKAGQSCSQILQAYYSGVSIVTVTVKK